MCDESEKAEKEFVYSDYFVSKEAFLIFVLCHIDKEKRAQLLGIKEEMYESISQAKEWRNSLTKILHESRCKHPFAPEALKKVNEIYARMKKNAK